VLDQKLAITFFGSCHPTDNFASVVDKSPSTGRLNQIGHIFAQHPPKINPKREVPSISLFGVGQLRRVGSVAEASRQGVHYVFAS
jgi:hypothetical protein